MLEGLINNNKDSDIIEFNLNSKQIYIMSINDDLNLNSYIKRYKTQYELSTIEVYVNMALIHGQTSIS